jgi:hypothetical protein
MYRSMIRFAAASVMCIALAVVASVTNRLEARTTSLCSAGTSTQACVTTTFDSAQVCKDGGGSGDSCTNCHVSSGYICDPYRNGTVHIYHQDWAMQE